jgi:putative membrane protein
MSKSPDSFVPVALGLAFAVQVIALGWAPHDREAWLLENLICVPVAVWLVVARRRVRLSTLSWWFVFAFLGLHETGSHYTYSLVPWMEWSREVLGWAPDWQRNHYDRFLHLAFGLLITLPFEELLTRGIPSRPTLRRLMNVCVIVTLSSGYELMEWAAALIFEPELGIGFVGAQGDAWDAQKDMALALAGCCIVIMLRWISNRRTVPC